MKTAADIPSIQLTLWDRGQLFDVYEGEKGKFYAVSIRPMFCLQADSVEAAKLIGAKALKEWAEMVLSDGK